jgi:hypothetical protein
LIPKYPPEGGCHKSILILSSNAYTVIAVFGPGEFQIDMAHANLPGAPEKYRIRSLWPGANGCILSAARELKREILLFAARSNDSY